MSGIPNTVLIYNNSIQFNHKNFKQQYKIEISIDGDAVDETSIISYKAAIEYAKVAMKPNYLAHVIISDFLLNFKYPDTMMQVIALRCREAIAKCVFEVNTKNEIIDLENFYEIVQKWNAIKPDILQEFGGETVHKYVLLFEKSLKNKEILLQKIRKNVFINQYFFPIFDEPYHGFEKRAVELFTFFDLDYEEDVMLILENEGNFDENDKAIISKKLIKNTSNTQLFPIESYETKYILNKDLQIETIEGAFINHNKKYEFQIETSSK